MIDFILDISFDARDVAFEELLQSRLFMTASTGSSSVEVNGTTTISAYFDSAHERDATLADLRDVDGIELHATERPRVDWLDRYQQSLVPIAIGRRFVVAPDAALIAANDDRLAIVVPQEQAFGTGSHETTSLCIEILESLDVTDKRGLDVGSGSGILAIAMHRLGAAKSIAFDNDPDAYGALRDNRIRNRVPGSALPLFIGSIEALRGGVFDVITMNIIPEVILPLLPDVVARMASDTQLILSGILVTRRDDVVRAAAEKGLRLREEREKGEWWAGVFSLS
ncbi:MAG TPA: 50S ribosomal protein L11 methyltransferase [Thermoanaerobaculia bacterium]|nr:50S ribosomal protein L11 methyltransferase [Thermoanaerobaculia bacterium]